MDDGTKEDAEQEQNRRSESMARNMPSFGKPWLSKPEPEEKNPDGEDSET